MPDEFAEGLQAKVAEQRRRDAENIEKRAVLFADGSGVYFSSFYSGPPGCNVQRLRAPRDEYHTLRERLGENIPIPADAIPAVIAKLQSFLLPPATSPPPPPAPPAICLVCDGTTRIFDPRAYVSRECPTCKN